MLFFVIAPINVLFLTVFIYGLYVIERAAEKNLHEELEIISRSLKAPLREALLSKDLSKLKESVLSALEFRRVYGVYVYDPDGKPILKLGRGSPENPPGHLTSLLEEQAQVGEYGQTDRRRIYSFFLPLVSGGQSLGLLQLTRTRREIKEVLHNIRSKGIIIMILAMSLATAAVVMTDRIFIQRPVNKLRSAMDRVSSGQWHTRVQVSAAPEISSIAEGLNRMLENLELARRQTHVEKRAKIQLSDELRRAKRLAVFGRFAAGIAHDVGTPLSVIDGIAQRELRQIKKGASKNNQKILFEDIRDEARKMDATLRQLLDFSRGSLPQFESVAIRQLMEDAFATIRPIATDANIALELESAILNDHLWVDPVQMGQVLVNLLKNAVEAARSRVRVEVEYEPKVINISVDDDGLGVEPEQRTKIFEPFFSTKASSKGSGLGLAVAHGIVAEHGGVIAVCQSEFGGSRFTISLPRKKGERLG